MNPILVIDDEEMYRNTISSLLRQAGYTVIEAENGRQGIELAQSHEFELIISDVMMDELDGFGLIERLRMDRATSIIPFIFVTGLSTKEDMRKGMALGADDFLVKPFTGAELLSAVEARVSKRKEANEESERKLAELRSSISLAMPHEIRTPLTSIIGFAEIFRDEGDKLSGPEVIQCGKLMFKAGKRLQRLVENFVNFTQIEVLALDPEKVALLNAAPPSDGVMTIREVARHKAEAFERVADLDLSLEDCQVKISEEHFKKILDELLDNAFKFSLRGSRVTVSGFVSKNRYVITLMDHGRGMTREQRASLGAFVQFERKLYEQQGAGLGLAIVKRLIDLHQGRMEFENSPDGGLTVRVVLPVFGHRG